MTHTIGTISINISFLIYCLYFLPQILYNQLKHQAFGISYGTQLLMILANVLDLIYGFGFDLQWQYKAVTLLTLGLLVIQQYQIYRDSRIKSLWFHMLAVLLLLIGGAIAFKQLFPARFLETVGFISMICYSIYWLPQIIKNVQYKSAQGFSLIFMVLNASALICDEISALSFSWPMPSIVSPLVILSFLFVIIAQRLYYRRLQMIIN
ncbi:PQ-loop repeat-containing protein [Facilibium subflavum]|uniref:PQ-loop repeat-containing protein n=1 Tax=Facilibium subflavum TaxID=2219058 RepID=UPI000E649B84|nr:PQ-loop repeat-containing protein [Facilibium subflavum]